jgi:integrase
MAKVLTANAVRNAKPATTRTEIPDRGCVGLYLIVQPSGAKSWALRYRFGGVTRKLTLGAATDDDLTLASARRAAAEARHQIDLGVDPATSRRPPPIEHADDSVEALAEQFINLHVRRKTRPTTARMTEDVLTRIALPAWRGRLVQDIRRRDIVTLAERIALDRPYMANRALAALSKFFAWMVARDVIAVSPCVGVERPHLEIARDRILTDAEIKALWRACDDPTEGPFGPLLKLLLLTGARRGECCNMRWSEIDADRRLWLLPGGRTKNGRAHAIPLSEQVWRILQGLPRFLDSDFVITVDGRQPFIGFARAKRRIDAKAKLGTDWRLHDLRRTCASGLQRLGVSVEVIERSLNHVSGTFRGVAGVYARHDYADEIRIALQRWGDHVEQIVGGKPAKIIKLRGRR